MITDALIWTDGRTGPIGQIAGDLALTDLSRRMGLIEHLKGTIFKSSSHLIVGRVCASNRYLVPPEIHWSTYEPDQEIQLSHDPRFAGRAIHYLFVTLMPGISSVTYWLIPSRVMATTMSGVKARRDGAVFVRIREEGNNTFLYGTDVTQYRHDLPLNESDLARLMEARLATSPRASRPKVSSPRLSGKPTLEGTPSGPPASEITGPAMTQVSTVIMGRDGLLSLPEWLRRRMSLTEGMRAVAYQDGKRIVLQPVRPGEHRQARGSLKGTGAFKALVEERQNEREL